MNQIAEISDIRWFSISDIIKTIDTNPKHQNLYNSSGNLLSVFKKAINKFKTEIKSYYYD
jgi:NADH pyrophosphatase NudC (nudix superfamily)